MRKLLLLLLGVTLTLTSCQKETFLDEYNSAVTDLEAQAEIIQQLIGEAADAQVAFDAALAMSDAGNAAQLVAFNDAILEATLVINSLQADIDAGAENAAFLSNEIIILQASIAAANDMIAGLEAEVASLTDQLAAVSLALAELEANPTIVTVTEYVDVVRTVIETVIITEVVTVTVQDADVIADLNDRIAALELTNDGVTQSDVDAIQEMLTEANTALASATTNDLISNETIATLEGIRDTLQRQVETLQGQLDAALANLGDDTYIYGEWLPATGDGSSATFVQTRTSTLVIAGSTADATAPVQEELTRTVNDDTFVEVAIVDVAGSVSGRFNQQFVDAYSALYPGRSIGGADIDIMAAYLADADAQYSKRTTVDGLVWYLVIYTDVLGATSYNSVVVTRDNATSVLFNTIHTSIVSAQSVIDRTEAETFGN